MVIALSTLTLAAPAVAQQSPIVACSARVYTNDPDPKGTNIRNAPGSKGTVIKTLSDDDTQLEVTGSSGDWLRIKSARGADGASSFAGEGWVFAPLMAVRARGAATLRASDSDQSAATASMRHDEQAGVLGCKGDWLRVKYRGVSGWLKRASQCGNPVTTCA